MRDPSRRPRSSGSSAVWCPLPSGRPRCFPGLTVDFRQIAFFTQPIHDPGVDREKSLTIVEGNKDFLVRKIPPVWTYPPGDVCTTKTLKTSLHVGLCIHTQGTSSCPTSGRERRGQLARPDLGIWIYLQEHGSWVEIDEYPSLSIPTNRSCI